VRGASLAGATVRLDRATVLPLSINDSEIRVQMPAHDNGFVVISARHGNEVAYAEFLYLPPALHELPPGFITTVAGIGSYTRAWGDARSASIGAGTVSFDAAGNLYLGDAGGARVHRVRTDGTIEPFAGTGTSGTTGDGGPALDADIDYPRAVAFDGAGNAYIGGDRCQLRRVDPGGIITTVAGDGLCGFSGDGGPARLARIASPTWIAADQHDVFFVDFTYVVESGSGGPRDSVRIRRIHLGDGTISTFAGNGGIGFSGDGGPATAATFDFGSRSVDAGALALDPQGHVYVADAGNSRIRRIDRTTGIINTFHVPQEGEVNWLTFDPAGNLYYAAGRRIVKRSANGGQLTTWGASSAAFPPDGSPAATSSLSALSLAIDPAGNIVYSDGAINRVRRINLASGLIESVAGIGPAIIGENGPALAATLATVTTEGIDLAFAPSGELVIADAGSFRLRRLEKDGTLTTLGGTGGQFGSQQDGVAATQVSMYPIGLAVDARGAIDLTNRSDIFHIEPDGLLTHITRRDVDLCVLEGDGGPVDVARVCQPMDVARDAGGHLFIADTNNNRIRRVDASTKIITTVVGNGGPVSGYERYGFGSFCGDGGAAVSACLNAPWGMAFDDEGRLYISELGRIRKVELDGTIHTFVEQGGFSKLLVHRGFLYGSTSRFDAGGVRQQLAGGNTANPLLGDGGPALEARTRTVGTAVGVAIDAEGNLYFADIGHRRIRAIRYGAVLAPPGAIIDLTANGATLYARVADSSQRPLPSVRVDFTVPASGASCTLSTPFAITDADGTATVTCTPNCVAGSYAITARPLTSPSSDAVTFTNPGRNCRRRATRS